jgi:hypothetical protein
MLYDKACIFRWSAGQGGRKMRGSVSKRWGAIVILPQGMRAFRLLSWKMLPSDATWDDAL